MSPQMLQYILPLVLIAVVVALRARKLSRKQPLKLGRLWIRPVFLLAACILVLAIPQPGVAPRHFALADWAMLALAAGIGGIGGWYLGRTMAIEVHPEDGTLMVQASPVGLIVLVGLMLARTGLRAGARLEAQAWHLDVVLIFDALIVFTAGLFIIRSLEMYLRAKKLVERAGAR
jgi:hypothetical protein